MVIKTCIYCGTVNHSTSTYCSKCAHPITESWEENTSKTTYEEQVVQAEMKLKVPLPKGYFESPVPSGDGFCSDEECPCDLQGVKIQRGSGYLWISEEVVDFRCNAKSLPELLKKMEEMEKAAADRLGMPNAVIIMGSGKGVWTPVLMREQGARKRGLDMNFAAADAKYWWETGFVPLRPTPHKTN